MNYDNIIKKYADLYRVDKNLIKAIIRVESNFDKTASRKEYSRSGKYIGTSYGLMQILYPSTAKALSPKITLKQLQEPETNIRLGTKYLSDINRRYKNLNNIVASYNAGSVKLNKQGQYINSGYVNKVLYHYFLYSNSMLFFGLGLGLLALYSRDRA